MSVRLYKLQTQTIPVLVISPRHSLLLIYFRRCLYLFKALNGIQCIVTPLQNYALQLHRPHVWSRQTMLLREGKSMVVITTISYSWNHPSTKKWPVGLSLQPIKPVVWRTEFHEQHFSMKKIAYLAGHSLLGGGGCNWVWFLAMLHLKSKFWFQIDHLFSSWLKTHAYLTALSSSGSGGGGAKGAMAPPPLCPR